MKNYQKVHRNGLLSEATELTPMFDLTKAGIPSYPIASYLGWFKQYLFKKRTWYT